MRRVLLGGLIGAAPGAVIIGGTVLLLSLDVITSDQSQIAFLGIPVLLIGALVGPLVPAVRQGVAGPVAGGMGIGFVVGVAASIGMAQLNEGLWLWLVPVLILAGAAAGAWWADHHPHPTGAAPQQ